MEPVEERGECFLCFCVDAGGRLVQDEQLGLGRQGLGDEGPLLLAARESHERAVRDVGQPNSLDRLVDHLAISRPGPAEEPDTWEPPCGDHLANRRGSAHPELGALGQVPDRFAPGEPVRRLTEEERLARARPLDPENESQQCRLAAAVGSGDRDELSAVDGQVDGGEHGWPLAVRERQRPGLDGYRHPSACRRVARFSRMTEK